MPLTTGAEMAVAILVAYARHGDEQANAPGLAQELGVSSVRAAQIVYKLTAGRSSCNATGSHGWAASRLLGPSEIRPMPQNDDVRAEK